MDAYMKFSHMGTDKKGKEKMVEERVELSAPTVQGLLQEASRRMEVLSVLDCDVKSCFVMVERKRWTFIGQRQRFDKPGIVYRFAKKDGAMKDVSIPKKLA